MTPSIGARLRAEIEPIYATARGEAVARLWEDVDFELRAPNDCPYGWDEITGAGGWMPERVAAAGLPEPPRPGRRRAPRRG
jgi:hypothetical protein